MVLPCSQHIARGALGSCGTVLLLPGFVTSPRGMASHQAYPHGKHQRLVITDPSHS